MKSIFEKLKRRKLVRRLDEFRRHLRDVLHVNDDLLLPSAKEKANAVLSEADGIDAARDPDAAGKFLERADLRVAKILPSRSFPTLREYADILAVAFSVAFGVRALYLQPFKIPTSSMQPTLFGIHYVQDGKGIPDLPQPLAYLLYSARRADLRIKRGGYLDQNSLRVRSAMPFSDRTRFTIGGVDYEMPGGEKQVVVDYLKRRVEFEEGELVCKGWLSLGDHLFVDRFSIHFREPRRGDVIVFVTDGLKTLDGKPLSGPYYIKRLIGMPGDTLKIVDRTVFVRTEESSRFVPISDFGVKNINKIYDFKGGYHGHLAMGLLGEGMEFRVPAGHYFMLGDNSSNSSDSRDWGTVPRKNIIGRAFFIFWPFSRRWGIPDRAEPLPFHSFSVQHPMEYQ